MINEDPKDAMLREYQAEISKLKAQLAINGPVSEIANDLEVKQRIEEEKAKITQFYEEETMRLKEDHEKQRKQKEDLLKGESSFLCYGKKYNLISHFTHQVPIKTIQIYSSYRHDRVESTL